MDEGYAIAKDKKNATQGYQYRGIDQVMNVFQPLLAKYKVFIVPEVISHEREERTTGKGTLLLYSVCTIKYTFYAEDGSSVSAVVVGEGMDSGDKATNKAMSVAMKYAMFQTFCIPTEEMHDSEEDSPEPLPKAKKPEQKKEAPKKSFEGLTATIGAVNEIRDLCQKYDKKEVDLCSHYKIKALEEMTEPMVEDCKEIFKKIEDKK